MKVHVGEMLREVIREKGMAKQALAKGLGVHPTAVAHVLKQRDMKLSRLLRMEELLGVDLVWRMRPEYAGMLAEKDVVIGELEARLAAREREMELMAKEVEVLRRIAG